MSLIKKNLCFYPGEANFTFISIFEESVSFDKPYTLPFNTLVAVYEDRGRDDSSIENGIDGKVWRRRKGYLYFTPPYLPVNYVSRTNLQYIALFFQLERLPGVDVFSGMREWIVEHAPAEVQDMKTIFDLEDRVLALSRLQDLALRFCIRHWPENYGDNLRHIQRFEKVLHYIREHGNAETKVSGLASLLHLAPETFSREFTRALRKSPKEFLQSELTRKASRLLMKPDHNVKEAAAALGFSSEFYFSKFFKRQTGISPSDYRKNFGW